MTFARTEIMVIACFRDPARQRLSHHFARGKNEGICALKFREETPKEGSRGPLGAEPLARMGSGLRAGGVEGHPEAVATALGDQETGSDWIGIGEAAGHVINHVGSPSGATGEGTRNPLSRFPTPRRTAGPVLRCYGAAPWSDERSHLEPPGSSFVAAGLHRIGPPLSGLLSVALDSASDALGEAFPNGAETHVAQIFGVHVECVSDRTINDAPELPVGLTRLRRAETLALSHDYTGPQSAIAHRASVRMIAVEMLVMIQVWMGRPSQFQKSEIRARLPLSDFGTGPGLSGATMCRRGKRASVVLTWTPRPSAIQGINSTCFAIASPEG